MLTSYLLALFFVAAAGASLRWLPVFHPAQLWTIPWALATLFFALRLLPLKPVEPLAAGLVVASTACFAGASLLAGPAYAALPARAGRGWFPSETQVRLPAALAVAALVIALGIQLWTLVSTFGVFETIRLSPAVKTAYLTGENPRYVYFAIASVALTALAAAYVSSATERRVWGVACGLSVASVYFSTSRSIILYLVGVAMLTFLLGRPSLPGRRRLLVGGSAFAAVVVVAMIALGLIQGRSVRETGDTGSVSSVFAEHRVIGQLGIPYGYATLPLSALNQQVKVSSTWGRTEGCATLRIACSALKSAGFDVEPKAPARPFTARPLRWNLYTSLDLPLVDGGKILAPLIMGITGFVLGLLWEASRRRTMLGQIGYPIFGAACFYGTTKFEFASQSLIGALIIVLLLIAAGSALASGLAKKESRLVGT